tara:strand:+ start:166 stop:561 length:396 start_codon:yes stop_codon:yes gene_type:complete
MSASTSTKVTFQTKYADYLWVDTDADATLVTMTGLDGGTLFAVEIDNTGNADTAAYFKFWFAGSGPTVGTTDPFLQLKAPAAKSISYTFPEGITLSWMGSGLAYYAVTTAATKGSSASPASDVSIKILYSD